MVVGGNPESKRGLGRSCLAVRMSPRSSSLMLVWSSAMPPVPVGEGLLLLSAVRLSLLWLVPDPELGSMLACIVKSTKATDQVFSVF